MRKLLNILALAILFFGGYNTYVCNANAKPYQDYNTHVCFICGKANVRTAVHHIIPQEVAKDTGRPELINDPNNLVTLCDPLILRSSGCHWKYGHRGKNWKYDNSKLLQLIIDYIRRSEVNESNN